MGFTTLVATAISTGISAYGAVSKGQAQAAQDQYQAGIAQMNATIAKQNADYAVAAGEEEAQQSGMKTRFQIGTTIAQQGAGGLAVGSGSNARVVQSELAIGQQDQALIRSNAARKAYGYEVEAANATAQGQVFKAAAANDLTAGYISAAGSLIGGAGSVASKWTTANQVGLFSSLGSGDGPSSKESVVS